MPWTYYASTLVNGIVAPIACGAFGTGQILMAWMVGSVSIVLGGIGGVVT